MKNTPVTVLGFSAMLAAATLLHSAESQPVSAAPTQAESASSLNSHRELLTPANSVMLLIDHQPQMIFGVRSHDRQSLRNNVQALSKAAKAFEVPTVLTTVAAKSFSGPLIKEIKDLFPGQEVFDRTSMNTWDDKRVTQAIADSGRKKIVLAALWTEVCATMPTLEALAEGYDVYVVTDASGGTSQEAHDMAVMRMVQAGAVPVTWQQVMLEWQRDWSRQETYTPITDIAKQHSGAYGVGIEYSYSMFGAEEGGHK